LQNARFIIVQPKISLFKQALTVSLQVQKVMSTWTRVRQT
jgi:hypothetical protein